VAIELPARVRLENPFLGSQCYIGSSSHPIMLNLTSAVTNPPLPNRPISGEVGQLEFRDEFTFIGVKEDRLVDNSFSTPGATGCGGSYAPVIDPVIDAKLGLPSAAGRNTLIQVGTLDQALSAWVTASEK
jgi:hypothetical protein